ncbi:MAG: ATP-binding cassette domain-containing protein [Proteobacteria bacterium]|nr:ATP-binding cassette domain-containing protein [Pseudomonadota bacterium]
MTADHAPVLKIRNLSVTPKDAPPLLEGVQFDLNRGEVVLLTGPSGCGKSTLIKILAGIVEASDSDWQVTGSAQFEGTAFDLALARPKTGGMVFQNFALFDDLTAGANVQIAFDHGGAKASAYAGQVENLLRGINIGATVRDCSGGQQQRIAIARTLVADKPILFMDEPNSGLDIQAARDLALIIRGLSDELGIAIVVVAHHLEAFRDVADRLLVIEPGEGRILDLGKPETTGGDHSVEPHDEVSVVNAKATASSILVDLEPTASAWKRLAKWQLRYFVYYMWLLCLSPSMLLFVGLGGILVGFVSTAFIFQYFPYREYLIPVIQNDALAGIGFVQFRLLVPLVVSILIATRNGAIVSADVGNRVYSSQLSAMENLRIPQRWYIRGNTTLSLVLGSLILSLAAMAICAWFSMQTWHALFPEQSVYFWREHYFRGIWPSDHIFPVGLTWVLAKILPSAVGTNLISLYFGSRPKNSVADLNNAIANSIIFSVSFVFIWHSLLFLSDIKY